MGTSYNKGSLKSHLHTTAAGDGGFLDVGEGLIHIHPFQYSSITQGTWVWVQTNNWISNTVARALNDEVNYKAFLDAGTYQAVVMFTIGPDHGNLHILIDGVDKGNVDGYNGGAVNYKRSVIANIVIATSGLVNIGLKVASKHASSTSYYMYLNLVTLYRTA